jgi:hypothetical protein
MKDWERRYRTEEFDVEAGVGFGLTPASDRLVMKFMISRDLYKPPLMSSETRAQALGQKPFLGSLPPSWWSPATLGPSGRLRVPHSGTISGSGSEAIAWVSAIRTFAPTNTL